MNNIQPGFVNIQTLFGEKTERTVAALAELYQDEKLLQDVLSTLSANMLTDNFVNGKKQL